MSGVRECIKEYSHIAKDEAFTINDALVIATHLSLQFRFENSLQNGIGIIHVQVW